MTNGADAPLRTALRARRSRSRVTGEAPSHEELLPLVAAAARMPDHGSLRPWRLIELRGSARERLGAAMVAADSLEGEPAERLAAKPLRAELLIALVAVRRPSIKVPAWEQDAAAAGIGHALVLLLEEAGWGVVWRTGPQIRSEAVRLLHGLGEDEELLGWLYVGGVRPEDAAAADHRPSADPAALLTALEG